MEDTGCDKCTEAMKLRGSANLCLDCEIEWEEWQADMHMRRVEELKKKRDAAVQQANPMDD